MSPNELEIASASEVRSKYAFLFECVIQLYDFSLNKKSSKKYEEVRKVTEELYKTGIINDYIYENLKQLYALYPTMTPGKVAEGYKKDRKKEEDRLIKLSGYLSIIIGDLCGEIKELCDKASAHDKEQLAYAIKAGILD